MSGGWRRALDIYVAGRNRSLSLQEKDLAVRREQQPSGGRSILESPSFGVAVPQELQFFRNAGTWRDRLGPGGRDERGSGA